MKFMLDKLEDHKELSPAEMTRAMESIVSGKVSDSEIETFLIRLHGKGESADEIAAAAMVMRRHAVQFSKLIPDLLDTCGTGGDSKNTFNVSTLSAIVAAASGVKVAKHGNRSVSSLCGSADLLEMLDVRIDIPAKKVQECIERIGFGFLYAPNFHPAMKFAAPARKKIKGRTIFNLLGPLSNPAGAKYQLVGVFAPNLTEVFARVLKKLGAQNALVVHGSDGLDEISLSGTTKASFLHAGKIKNFTITPEELGFKRFPIDKIKCDSKEACLAAAKAVLKGTDGPMTDMVCLNTGAALFVAGRVHDMKEGIQMARETIKKGLATKKLVEVVNFTKDAA